jgi:hypothetical protein
MLRNGWFNSKFMLFNKSENFMKNLTKMTEDNHLGFEKKYMKNHSKSVFFF